MSVVPDLRMTPDGQMQMTCGCMFYEVHWEERVHAEACGCTSCEDCGLVNTQDPNPKNWKCHADHPLSCTKEEEE